MAIGQRGVPEIPGTSSDLFRRRGVHIDDHVTFLVRYSNFKPAGTGYFCNLSGEFLYDGKPFDPPKAYSLTNVRTMTNDIASIVKSAYANYTLPKGT